MSFTDFLRKTSAALRLRTGASLATPIEAQRAYIERFPAPKDDVERSYDQYRCQMFLLGRGISALLNAASFPVAVVLALHYRAIAPRTPERHEASAALLIHNNSENVLPDSLSAEFPDARRCDAEIRWLRSEDTAFVREMIQRYPFAWHFHLKALIKLGSYRAAVDCVQPKALIAAVGESSFTSSLLTAWCERRQIEHINVMHGIFTYDLLICFFRFHRFYVWDDFFVQLSHLLRAAPDRFITELAPCTRMTLPDTEKQIDLTYYLASETGEQLERLLKTLLALSERGIRIALRTHPHYDVPAAIRDISHILEVEDPEKIALESSIGRTRLVASFGSTVLYQAYLCGVETVLDDVTNPANYEELKKAHFIMMDKPHRLLSEVLKEAGAGQ